jgi:hypothetical protein
MDLILLILALAIIGFLVHLITTKIPMDPMFKLAIQIIVIFAIILYLIRRFGGSIPNVL